MSQQDFDLAAYGLELLVVDTCAPHQLNDGQYAARRKTCEEAAAELGVRNLRQAADQIADASRGDADRKREGLDRVLAALSDPTEIKRVRHVITEIWRVEDFAEAFGSGDIRTAGSLFNASHDSLRYDYEVTAPELDTAVEVARSNGAYGARMTGGGFGGSIIALVDKGQSRQLAEKIAEAFSAKGFRQPQALTSVASRAAERVA